MTQNTDSFFSLRDRLLKTIPESENTEEMRQLMAFLAFELVLRNAMTSPKAAELRARKDREILYVMDEIAKLKTPEPYFGA